MRPHRTKCLQPHGAPDRTPGIRSSCPTPPSPGTPGGTRTPDPELRRLLLYPPELPGLEPPRGNTGMAFPVNRLSGRGRGIRTPDILLPKQVRCQTAPYPAALGTRSCHGRSEIVLSHSDFVKPIETLAPDSRASAPCNGPYRGYDGRGCLKKGHRPEPRVGWVEERNPAFMDQPGMPGLVPRPSLPF